MKIYWSPTLKGAIRDVLDRAEQDSGILDAYAAASHIQKELPDENVALEDIISALLLGRGSIRAIEFIPPTPTILEIVLPTESGEGDPMGEDGEESAAVAQ
jgi:hypothetical protein